MLKMWSRYKSTLIRFAWQYHPYVALEFLQEHFEFGFFFVLVVVASINTIHHV